MRRVRALAIACLALAAGGAMARTSPLRGVVEGYYGRPWSHEARRDVIRFLARRGMNTFVYGPKNDPYHRDRWREPYPEGDLVALRTTAATARRAGVRFVYAVSPALDVRYSDPADFDALTAKLGGLARRARIRRFALFFDDAPDTLSRPEDVARYGGSDGAALGRAQAHLVDRIDRWLRRRGLPGVAFIVPTAYSGTACLPYHGTLADGLRRRLPIGWTGLGVFSTTLTGAQARARRACLGGHPVVLWDNFPVNDGVLSNTLHLGPLAGRDAALPGELAAYLLNPMTQPYASLVGLGTAASYLRRPRAYDPETAWRAVLAELDPGGDLAVLAEQTRGSPLDHPDYGDAAALGDALAALADRWATPEWGVAVDALEAEAHRQSAAAAGLATRLGETPLGREIASWVAELAAHAREALEAVELLRAMRPTFVSMTVESGGDARVVRGRVAPPDVARAAALAGAFTVPRPPPSLTEYLRCLGDLLGPDIARCPELGLNVHGKRLYFVPFDFGDLRLITGLNLHDRLVADVATRWVEWTARQAEAPTHLTLTAGTTPVPLDANGAFSVTDAPPVRLVARTGAGDATALVVP